MGDLLLRNLDDRIIDTFRHTAEMNGTTLEDEVRAILTSHARPRLTLEEKVAILREIRSRQPRISEPLTREEIREGLE